MPLSKRPLKGKKWLQVSVKLDPESYRTAQQIANFSAFIRISLRHASEIMAVALLELEDPKNWPPSEGITDRAPVEEFNAKYPPHVKRRESFTPRSQTKPEIW